MILIKFIKQHGKHNINTVIGTKDSAALQLIAAGIAVRENEGIKPLKYPPGVAPRVECVVVPIDEMEASPKGAKWPEEIEIETVVSFDDIESVSFSDNEQPTIKYKNKLKK